MLRRIGTVVAFLLVGVSVAVIGGCAGSGGSSEEIASDPVMLRREIVEIDNEILNMEEMYKASLTELQMEEDTDLRREVNRMWIELEHLRSQKTALEQRLAELEAEKKQ